MGYDARMQGVDHGFKDAGHGFSGPRFPPSRLLTRTPSFRSPLLARLLQTLPSLVVENMEDTRNEAELIRICSPVLAAKQYGYENILAPLVAKACMQTMRKSGRASVTTDSVRIAKIIGGNISQSECIAGMVIMRGTEGSIQHAKGKVAVFACGVEASATEAKGTVLMKNADDLMSYNKSEEKKMDEIIKVSERAQSWWTKGTTWTHRD